MQSDNNTGNPIGEMGNSFYELEARQSASDEPLRFSNLQNKVILVVNVASQCTFTPQYKELEQIYKRYKEYGFEILAFPCNQFSHQEPGSDVEIKQFCQENFGVTFPIMHKIKVNGSQADPVYQYLKEASVGPLGLKTIKWNFEKFLIDRNGHVRYRYGSLTRPLSIADAIEELIGE